MHRINDGGEEIVGFREAAYRVTPVVAVGVRVRLVGGADLLSEDDEEHAGAEDGVECALWAGWGESSG
jgi:hypothetical protein